MWTATTTRKTGSFASPKVCLALVCAVLGAGCTSQTEPAQAPAPEVSVHIRFHESTEARDQERDPAGHTGMDSILRILIDITYADSGQSFAQGFALTQRADDQWAGTLPSLPRNQQLRFHADAFDAQDTVVFSGETLAVLGLDSHSVQIPLAPAQALQTIDMPRLVQIVYPSEITAGQAVEFVFTVEGNPGETIDYVITSLSSRVNPFSPASGSVTLSSTVADFVSLYTAPEVSQTLTFEHEVALSAAAALSEVVVATRFKNPVRPPPYGVPIVRAPELNVRFNPVVLSLTANGTATPGQVRLTADVSDDGDPAQLIYQWRYTPDAGTPAANFANDGAGNPGILQGYTVSHQGTLTLEVTDEDGGTTTLYYELPAGQFAGAIDHDAVSGLVQIVAGDAHTCVLTGAGTVRCWGDAWSGQLGYGNTQDVGDAPERLPFAAGDVPLPAPAIHITAGDNHTCALLESGMVYCWGQNTHGQLGYGHTEHVGDDEPVTSFGHVTLGGAAATIAAGGDHTCAILSESGALRCWGRNAYGQLGHGHTSDIGDDEDVFEAGNVDLGPVTVHNIALGDAHTCALLDTGTIRCWGRNDYGQLGYGHDAHLGDDETVATLTGVALPGPVRKVVAGPAHTCVLLEDSAVRCWGYGVDGRTGYGFRPLSDPGYGDQSGETPIDLPDIATGAPATDIVAGDAHTCALLSNGDLRCWGEGSNGRLGYGNADDQPAPPATGVDLHDTSPYHLTAGRAHTCALRSNGTAQCWGAGSSGRLGHGASSDVYSPAAAGDIAVFPPELPDTAVAAHSHFLVPMTGEQKR